MLHFHLLECYQQLWPGTGRQCLIKCSAVTVWQLSLGMILAQQLVPACPSQCWRGTVWQQPPPTRHRWAIGQLGKGMCVQRGRFEMIFTDSQNALSWKGPKAPSSPTVGGPCGDGTHRGFSAPRPDQLSQSQVIHGQKLQLGSIPGGISAVRGVRMAA